MHVHGDDGIKEFLKPRFLQPLQRIAVVGIGDNCKFEPAVPECRECFGYMRVGFDCSDLLIFVDGAAQGECGL